MIGKFIQSKLSGYTSLLLIPVTLFLVWYIFNQGQKSCKADVQENKMETINENIDTRKRQDKVVPIDGKRSLISGLRDDTAL